MTFDYMVHMSSTSQGYFPVTLRALRCYSSRLTEMHILSSKDTDLRILG